MKCLLSSFFITFTACLAYGQDEAPKQQQQQPLQPVLLQPEFQPGKTYRFIANTNIYMAPPDQPERRILMEQQARYDVDPRSDGRKGVAVRGLTERLKVDIQSGQKTVSYDSLSKENQKTKIGRHFESTVNRYVKMELDEEMKILSHKEGGRSAGATPLPGLPRFGPEELVQIVTTIPQGYAPDPVVPGDEWVLKGKRAVGELGDLGFEVSYKNLGMMKYEEHMCFVIEFRGQLNGDITDDNSKNVDFQGSRIAGNILFDPKEKITRYSEHNISMVINLPDPKTRIKRSVPMQQKAVLKLMQIVKKK